MPRTINVQGYRFNLATRPDGDGWLAYVEEAGIGGGPAHVFQRPITGIDEANLNPVAMIVAIQQQARRFGATEDEALGQLDADLTAAVKEATRIDLDEINRRPRHQPRRPW